MLPDRSTVVIKACEDYERSRVEHAVRGLLEPLGGMAAFVHPGMRVLLKPNLILPRPADAAVLTHPEIVRAVALLVREAGGVPFVADSPAFSSAGSVADAGGLTDALAGLDVPILDLGKAAQSRQMGEDAPFDCIALSGLALDADAIINLPKVKTHCQMGMSLGIKNLFGCVAGKRKALLHWRTGNDYERFGEMLASVARAVKPALTLEDGIVVLERNGPTSGDPRNAGFLVASSDCLAADRVVLDLLGVDPAMVPYMEPAERLGCGIADLNDIDRKGDGPESLRLTDYVTVSEMAPISFSLPRVVKSVCKQVMLLARAKMAR